LREVEAIVPAEGLGLSMARVAMTSDHTRRPDGLIDVEGHMTGEAVKALAPGEARMELGGFEASARIEGYDIAAVERIMSEFEALTADGAPPTPEELSAVLGRLANESLLPETFVEQFGLSGLNMSGPGGEPLFALDSAEISLKGEGLNEGFGTGSFGLRFGGLVTPDQPAAGDSMREIVPHSGGIIVTAHRLPLQEIWTVVMQSASMAAMNPSQPGQPDAFGAMVGIQMLAAIQRAGTSLTLDRLFSESAAAGVSVEGKIEPQPGSALGFTAKGEARITGLDRLIELAQQDANPQGATPQGAPGMPLGMLTRLKEIGRRQQGSDGKAVDNYEIELTARGEFLVNGEPFGPPGMAPGGPGQTPQ
ncbi:MAG TPA: hypothetical protein VLL72_07000, partial [Kiloniellales bacterium]|nr:hypothetical protein [Kiloniellales bacterium]